MKSDCESYRMVCGLLEKKQPFSFSRFGDGEWFCILRNTNTKMNCDGHYFFEDMGEGLANVLKNYQYQSNYYLAIMPLVYKLMLKEVNEFLKDVDPISWEHSLCFWGASRGDYIWEYFKLIRESNLLMVGPDYLMKFEGWNHFITIPDNNCWLDKDAIIERISKKCEEEKFLVVSISASMASCVIIDELYKKYGNQHIFIDAGSIYDPYLGRNSRKFHKKVIRKLNYEK